MKKKIIVSLILVLPIILLTIFTIILYGNPIKIIDQIIENRNHLSFGPEAYPDFSDSLGYIVTLYSIIITAIFSFMVWKTSKRSYEVAEAVKTLEENRDNEESRKSALIVYYELLTSFDNLREMYSKKILNSPKRAETQFFISTDWIKNIANLRDSLSREEINELHIFYNRLLTLQKYLELDSNNGKASTYLSEIVKDSFSIIIPKEVLFEDFGHISKYLNRKYFLLISKIYKATFRNEEIQKEDCNEGVFISINGIPFYRGEIKGKHFSGAGTIFNDKGLPKYNGKFIDSKFVEGKAYEYFENEEKLYDVTYKNNQIEEGFLKREGSLDKKYYYNGKFKDNKIFSGYTTVFNSSNKLAYEGYIQEGMQSGSGILYVQGEKRLAGEFENGVIIRGEQYKDKGFYFKGDFKNGFIWNGDVKGYSDSLVEEFEGTICDGKPYEGIGLVFKIDSEGQPREYLEWKEEQMYLDYDEPDEEEFEEIENQQQAYLNDQTRKRNSRWMDYIKAEWKKGEVKEFEDKEYNIKVFYYTDK